jgi:hypothetical protein
MKHIFNYTIALMMMTLINKSLHAQRYDDTYRSADADMLQVQGNNSIEHVLKGATIILPNGANQLHVTIKIPYEVFANRPIDNAEFLSPAYQFNLKVNIDPGQIQEVLTSARTFLTQGFLTLNNMTKPVKVSYVPIVSATNEDGNFNIYIYTQFNAADFGIRDSSSNSQFVLKINNGKVNRI